MIDLKKLIERYSLNAEKLIESEYRSQRSRDYTDFRLLTDSEIIDGPDPTSLIPDESGIGVQKYDSPYTKPKEDLTQQLDMAKEEAPVVNGFIREIEDQTGIKLDVTDTQLSLKGLKDEIRKWLRELNTLQYVKDDDFFVGAPIKSKNRLMPPRNVSYFFTNQDIANKSIQTILRNGNKAEVFRLKQQLNDIIERINKYQQTNDLSLDNKRFNKDTIEDTFNKSFNDFIKHISPCNYNSIVKKPATTSIDDFMKTYIDRRIKFIDKQTALFDILIGEDINKKIEYVKDYLKQVVKFNKKLYEGTTLTLKKDVELKNIERITPSEFLKVLEGHQEDKELTPGDAIRVEKCALKLLLKQLQQSFFNSEDKDDEEYTRIKEELENLLERTKKFSTVTEEELEEIRTEIEKVVSDTKSLIINDRDMLSTFSKETKAKSNHINDW